MLAAFAKAVQQMPHPAFRRVVIRSAILAALVFVVLFYLVGWALAQIGDVRFFWITWVTAKEMIEFVSGWGFNILSGFIALFLFPWVASIFIGLFVEEIAEAVEKSHYPGDPPGRSMPMWRGLVTGLKFIAVLVVLNLLAIPAYIIGFFFAPIGILVFYGLNGYLLSREYFELVAHRHMDERTVQDMRRRNRWRLMPAGMLMAFLFTVPVVNLFMPIIAAAAMVHIFKGMREVRASLQESSV
jgi:CysZ protein